MDNIFLIANTLALFSWLAIIIFSTNTNVIKTVKYFIVSILAVTYVVLIMPLLKDFELDSFATLQNVKELFTSNQMVTAGWIHYLAFDLFIGIFIIENSIALGIKKWKYLFCLPFTFMFGPLGLLLYYIFKFFKR